MKDSTKNTWKGIGNTTVSILAAMGRSIRIDQIQADYATTMDQLVDKMRSNGGVSAGQLRTIETMTRTVRLALENPDDPYKVADAEDIMRDMRWSL